MNDLQVKVGFQIIIEIHLTTIWEGCDGITSNCNDYLLNYF